MLVEDQAEHPLFGSYAGDFEEADIARIQGSSGTSGTPTLYRVSRRDWARSAELAALALWTCGFRPDDLAQISFPFALFFGGWGVLQGLERMGATSFPLGAIYLRPAPGNDGAAEAVAVRRHAELLPAPGDDRRRSGDRRGRNSVTKPPGRR